MEINEAMLAASRAYEAGNLRGASEICSPLVFVEPPHFGACLLLARIAKQQGAVEHSIALTSKALELQPDSMDALEQLVDSLLSAKRPLSQIDGLLQSVAETHFTAARFHVLAARTLGADGQHDAAGVALLRATECADATMPMYLAVVEQESSRGRHQAAIARLKQLKAHTKTTVRDALQISTLLFDAYLAIGDKQNAISALKNSDVNQLDIETALQYRELLFETGDIVHWKLLSDQLITRAPMQSGRAIAAEVLQYDGDTDSAQRAIFEGYSTSAEADSAVFRYTRLFFDADLDSMRTYESISASQMPKSRSPKNNSRGAADQLGHRPLKVGYISADFREHVMGRMALTILEGHDRAVIKTFCYSLSGVEDLLTEEIKNACDSFARCSGMSDSALASRIAADRLDVLIDLSGPTQGSRPEVLRMKPAPIIITHLGAAAANGLPQVDFKLTDGVCDLPEAQSYTVETLLPMSGCCYPVPKYPLPTAGLRKSDLSLEGKTVIGGFFSYMKLSRRCLSMWKNAIDAIPNSMFLFSPLNEATHPAYANLMAAAGIPPSRYQFVKPGRTLAERLARYKIVDFVLDTAPYGGVNGTLEALYMGVPVVTLLGKHHSERTSASMLTHLGVTDTIAQSPAEYVQIAKRLAEDAGARQEISTRIRARWPKFADPADYARRWEAVLRQVAL
jgi:predicted O-linked N-acetylglucosamine transferase (SPINDLY family)